MRNHWILGCGLTHLSLAAISSRTFQPTKCFVLWSQRFVSFPSYRLSLWYTMVHYCTVTGIVVLYVVQVLKHNNPDISCLVTVYLRYSQHVKSVSISPEAEDNFMMPLTSHFLNQVGIRDREISWALTCRCPTKATATDHMYIYIYLGNRNTTKKRDVTQ